MTKKHKQQNGSIVPFQVKRPRGRPRKFETPEDLMDAFLDYCAYQVKCKRPITKNSFKAYLFVNHGYFSDLSAEFSDTLKKIDMVCKAYAEEELFIGKNVAGVIFNLCNNYPDDYSNSRKFDHSGTLQVETLIKKIGSKKDEGKR